MGKDNKHLKEYSFKSRKEANEPPTLSSMDAGAVMATEPWRKGAIAGISVSFSSGTDDEFVHHYVVSLSRDGAEVASKKILADFYKHPDPSEMKSFWSIIFSPDDLDESCVETDQSGNYSVRGGSYTVTLTALDSWDASSEALSKDVSLP